MSRAMETGIVICPNDSLGNPRPPVTTTCGETWVLSGMIAKGRTGVTTRDFLGADLRHFIRELKRRGIGIRDEWETDAFGRHKRWWLKEGHRLKRIPKKKKLPTADTAGASKPTQNPKLGGNGNEVSI